MTTVDIRRATPSARSDAARRAADALVAGGLVVLPTETVYGVAGLAGSSHAMGTLREVTGLPEDVPLAWHAAKAEPLGAILPIRSGLHRRALERLTRGPVTFMIDLSSDELARVRAALGVPAGVVDDGATLLLRVPGHEFTREVLELVDAPVVLAGAAPQGTAAPTDARLSFDQSVTDRFALLVDDGPTGLRKPSTLVRLARDGSLSVVHEGAVDERFLRKRLTRTILFVCSGNTCRSPMAAAISNDLAKGRVSATEAPIHAESAGTGAQRGDPQAPEGVRALRALNIAPEAHQSRPLTRELIEDAERVFVMTPEHRRAAIELAPHMVERIETLDPEGGAIPDPIGGTQEVYSQTALRLRDLIARRLDEMDQHAPGATKAGGDA